MRISRRDALKGLGAAVGAAALGCGSDPSGVAGPDAPSDPPDAGQAPDGAPAPDAKPAPTAEQLLAGIDTFVVLCMENRSFDHYLGALRLHEGRMDIDGLTGDESNPAPDGTPVKVHRLGDYTPADPAHDWDPVHQQWNGGANDGFVRSHAGRNQADVMGYYTRDQLPITYALADGGTVCNRWFSSVLGPTWPNRFYLHGATSRGQKGNRSANGFVPVFRRMADAGMSYINYQHLGAWATLSYGMNAFSAPGMSSFFKDAAAGKLPNFALIDPNWLGNDDHPAHDIRQGQALIASVARAMAASPQWNKCLLIVTYDEHGGFYDHVPPPEAEDEYDEFTRLGFRVPSLVLGPTVRRGAAIDTVFEHSSIIATLTKRFGLEPMGVRAQKANDVSSCIDPELLGKPQPAPALPMLQMSQKRMREWPVNPDAHAEMWETVDALRPWAREERQREADAATREVLAWGERLGAIEIVD